MIERTSDAATATASRVGLLSFLGLLALGTAGCADAERAPRAAEGEGGEATAAAEAGSAETVAFVGATVVPMDRERVLEDHTVLVRGERIAEIGPAGEVEVPEGAVTVEAGGRWLIPGLGEMHAHVPPQAPEGMELTPWAERVLFLYLANGITTVRGMLGAPIHLELRDRVERGDLALSPRIYTSGPSLNGNSIPDPDSARRAVSFQAEAGYDFLKIHPGLSRPVYDAIAATAEEVGIRWAGHVPAAVGLDRALEAGQASIDHLDQYIEAILSEDAPEAQSLFFGVNLVEHVDESKIPEVARRTAEAGVWNVPTQSLIESVLLPGDPEEMARRPEMRYMPEAMVRSWVEAKRDFLGNEQWSAERARRFVEVRERIIGALHEAGARILLGSDAPQIFQVPGFSIHHELRTMVSSGLSPWDALAAGSRNVAEYFGALDEYGTIEEGKVADLVLLEGDPLADVGNVARRAGVMVRGVWIPAAEIDRRLAAIAPGAEDSAESAE